MGAAQAQVPHQPLDRAARHHHTLAVHLLPDLVNAIDLHVYLPNLLDVGDQPLIALDAWWQQLRMALPGCVQASPGP